MSVELPTDAEGREIPLDTSELFKVKCSNKDKCVMLPETGAYFIKQQAAAVWNSRSDNA